MNIASHTNPFESYSGSSPITKPTVQVMILMVMVIIASLSALLGLYGIVICLTVFMLIIYSSVILKYPQFGLIVIIMAAFIMVGFSRYVPGPWGLLIDATLLSIYVSLFFKGFGVKVQFNKAKSQLTVVTSICMIYVLFQILNPEGTSITAWFYAMRGLALYQWMIIPLVFILFNKQTDVKIYLVIWASLSLLGTLKGIQQFYFGVDFFEQRWLNEGGAQTHILFGKLRIFSFYTDAGQFGASQGHAAVVFGILAYYIKNNIKLKSFFIIVAVAGLIGLVISGTRGALSVPAMGGVMFLIMRKNLTVIALGAVLGFGVYFFFAHTTIGQGNAEIRRVRTAFDPNEASFQVRRNTQKKLVGYLASRPFGGGIGSAGNWGKRFSPNTYLANTPTDSWYVQIWAETGIVGLILYLFIILFVLFKGMYNVMFKLKDNWIRGQIMALTCGMSGIMVASYGNGVLGQLPTGILIYIGMVYMFISPKWDSAIQKKESIKQIKNKDYEL